MKPERENNFVELLDRLLNKGIILNADVIISVAGVPLIGISLKAAIASIETMLDYGMMEAWDKSTREWYANHCMKNEIQFTQDETIIYRTFGSIWHSQGIIHTWKPGFWYLTNKRLLLWREGEMLFEAPLEKIEALMVKTETRGKWEREVLVLKFGSEVARIHILDVVKFKEAVEKAAARNLEKAEIEGIATSSKEEELALIAA